MEQAALKDTLAEVETALRGKLTDADRATLEQTRSELHAALGEGGKSSALGGGLRSALEKLEGEHPKLTAVLSKALDALSDLGV
jgi:hypothetical protein